MLVPLYNQEEIVNHVENSSPTKFMYSFSKSNRFMEISKNGKTDIMYNLPSTIMKRKAGIGYGKRYDFTKEFNRGTEFLSIKRSYDLKNFPGLKYSFGLGRDNFKKQVCPGYKNIDKNIPGPASYNIIKTIGHESPKYSFRKICGQTYWANRYIKTPGPGTYSPKSSINKIGKFVNSKITNIKGTPFSKYSSSRWNHYKPNDLPSPGSYFGNNSLMGTLYNSKYNSGYMISMAKKFDIVKGFKDDTPGPGSYIHFSEFGMWVPKKYKKLNIKKKNDKKSVKNLFKKKIIRRVFSEDKSLLSRDRITSATT